jgi:hypothetical protein
MTCFPETIFSAVIGVTYSIGLSLLLCDCGSGSVSINRFPYLERGAKVTKSQCLAGRMAQVIGLLAYQV